METGPQGEPFVAEPLEDPFQQPQTVPAPAPQRAPAKREEVPV